MKNEQKKQVRDALMRYIGKFPSQTAAAETLKGISSSTISQVKNHNWELLSDRLWHHIARQVGFYCGEWQPADTSAHMLLRILLTDAQQFAMAYAVCGAPGLGKTFTTAHYVREHDNVLHVAGSDEYNRRSFLATLLTAVGIAPKGTVPQMMRAYKEQIATFDAPLLVIDDAHKLKDRVFCLVMILGSELAGKVGLVMLGPEELRERIITGLRKQRAGFAEVYDALQQRFVSLAPVSNRDVDAVCRANGIDDTDVIEHIASVCTDLHTVTQMVTQHREMRQAA